MEKFRWIIFIATIIRMDVIISGFNLVIVIILRAINETFEKTCFITSVRRENIFLFKSKFRNIFSSWRENLRDCGLSLSRVSVDIIKLPSFVACSWIYACVNDWHNNVTRVRSMRLEKRVHLYKVIRWKPVLHSLAN